MKNARECSQFPVPGSRQFLKTPALPAAGKIAQEQGGQFHEAHRGPVLARQPGQCCFAGKIQRENAREVVGSQLLVLRIQLRRQSSKTRTNTFFTIFSTA